MDCENLEKEYRPRHPFNYFMDSDDDSDDSYNYDDFCNNSLFLNHKYYRIDHGYNRLKIRFMNHPII